VNTEGQQQVGATDANGHFDVVGLQPGSYVIMATTSIPGGAPGGGRAVMAVNLSPGGDQIVTLKMTPGAALTVRVVDDAGKPIPGSGVTSYRVSENSQWPNLENNNGAQPVGPGQFELKGMTPGSYILTATVPGGKSRVRALNLTANTGEVTLGPEDETK
jgi:hypothetical protein